MSDLNVLLLDEHRVEPGPARVFVPPGSRSFAVLLGSGMPYPNPHRFGPAVAIIVDDRTYLFDAGEGIWRGLAKAALAHRGTIAEGLRGGRLTKLFLTHLHPDHVTGLPALMLHPFDLLERMEPLSVHGPIGTGQLVEGLLHAYDKSIAFTRDMNPGGAQFHAEEFPPEGGTIFTDGLVTVRALRVPHGNVDHAYAFRVETPDRVFVISGDLSETQSVADGTDKRFVSFAKGADVLFHECVTTDAIHLAPWKTANKAQIRERVLFNHVSTATLAVWAEAAQPGILALYHQQNYTDPFDPLALKKEVEAYGFTGIVVSGNDTDVF